MKQPTLTIVTFTTLTLLACSSFNLNSKTRHKTTSNTTDSCEIAKKFQHAILAEKMVANNYTGELNNYWGTDTTKLDFKHIFKDGQLTKSYFYYENQKVQEEYSFNCGALHGMQKWYYENGTLSKTIPYSYGYRKGTGQLFDQEGRLRQKVTFKNDSLVGAILSYDESGNLINPDSIKNE